MAYAIVSTEFENVNSSHSVRILDKKISSSRSGAFRYLLSKKVKKKNAGAPPCIYNDFKGP